MEVQRTEVEFPSGRDLCRAWLFEPAVRQRERTPCIVMAHGFGGTRDAGLEPYARRFAEDGWVVLVFDYRHFGASEGAPRQLLSVPKQLDDFQAAIDFARRLPGIDPAKIALWGSSFSGGHVVAAAVRDQAVAAVSSQCPMMDGLASQRMVMRSGGLWHSLVLAWHAVIDLVLALFRRPPHTVPIVGPPGSVAAMSTNDAEAGYRAIAPPGFRNEVAARIFLQLARYRPGLLAGRLRCPVLFQICEHDSVASPAVAEAAARRAGPLARVVRYPIGHFALYVGGDFERSVSDQRAFFRENL